MNKPPHYSDCPSASDTTHEGQNHTRTVFIRMSFLIDAHIEVAIASTMDIASQANEIIEAIKKKGLYREWLLYAGGNYKVRKEDYPITEEDLAHGWIENIEDEGMNRYGQSYELLKAFPEKNLSYGPNPFLHNNPILKYKIIYVIDPSKLERSKIDPDVYFILDDSYVVATVEIK